MYMSVLNRVLILLLTAWSFLPAVATAGTVYKSVDEHGKVTYSSSPPSDHKKVQKVDIFPPPSDKAVKQAQQRHEQRLKAAETLEQNRLQRQQQIAKENRIKRERQRHYEVYREPYPDEEQGPYYGIPGHGIIVLPGGPVIRPPVQRPPASRPPANRPPVVRPPVHLPVVPQR